jgi:hypothetical protein
MRSSIHRRARASLPAILLNPREHASLTAAHEQAIATNASTAPLDDEEAANDSAADIALHDEVDGAAASAEFSDVVRIQR